MQLANKHSHRLKLTIKNFKRPIYKTNPKIDIIVEFI